jgi:catechol 2,3-dioxygenase-like lactoylglutathione lyase family enzyme
MADSAVGTSKSVKVKFAFHPTFHVPNLEMSEEFFERVFARPSTLLEVMPKGEEPDDPSKPRGYSKMTMISDVLIDCVCPDLHRINGVQASPSVDVPVLQNIGWYSDDIDDTFRSLRRAKIPLVTQIGVPVEGDEPPTPDQGGGSGPIKMYFTPPVEMGLRYQFLTYFPMPIDPRSNPEWSLPAVSDGDPLGIKQLSHHVILTADPKRSIQLLVDALGGTVIHEGRDEQLGVSGPYVHLADAVYHFATPDAGSPGAAALAAKAPADKYYSMTWHVADLDRVASHLGKVGVKIQSRTDDTIVTDPSTSFQVPWGFTTRAVPGDPRG